MIICAAVKDNATGAIFGGIRHGNIHEAMHDVGLTRGLAEVTEGFLDEKNQFHDRREAFKIAMDCGQLSSSTQEWKLQQWEVELYSEDLY